MKNRIRFIEELLFFFFITLLSFLSFTCGRYTELDNSNFEVLQEKTFNTSHGKDFTLKAFSGDVIITTSDEPQVYVKILGNERAKKKVEFKFKNTDEGVAVIAERRDGWNFFNFGSGIKLRFEVRLPKNYNADVSSSGGDISLADLNGNIDFRSSGGDIRVKNSNGQAQVTTSGGDINLDNTSGNFELKTSGGDIKNIRFNGNVSASTSGGDIIMEGANGKIDAATSGGEITLNYSGQNMGISLISSGGDIKVKLPNDFNAQAKMYASGGDIECSFSGNNVQRISSSRYEADFNNGGQELLLKTSGGDIIVSKK